MTRKRYIKLLMSIGYSRNETDKYRLSHNIGPRKPRFDSSCESPYALVWTNYYAKEKENWRQTPIIIKSLCKEVHNERLENICKDY